MSSPSASRRQFVKALGQLGVGSALLPGLAWSATGGDGAVEAELTAEMLQAAAAVAGLSFTDEERAAMLKAVKTNLGRYRTLRELSIPNDVAPPFYFSPLVPGMTFDAERRPLRWSSPAKVTRPKELEQVAFWPVLHLAALLKRREVTSTELTQMYLARLHRHNEKLNCVVTFLDDLALAQAKQADAEIAAGKYRGPLHGIPWGAKDIIAVKGFKTTWGSPAYQDQVIDGDATVVTALREAGAVLLAKLTTGELAGGDQWFGGRTNNPWNLEQGSSGSSAGSASATTAGLVAFAIGTETSGSILSPASRCGATGLRPTFGRVSRVGAMALSWTQDRLGPICRSVEDCAVVMSAIAKPDGLDLSVTGVPFNWDARLDPKKLRVGYVESAFNDADRQPAWAQHEQQTLEKLRSLGVKLVPVNVPDFPVDALAVSVESGVFFDDLVRSGRVKSLKNKNRAENLRVSRFVPAVEYLRSQRARTLMMQQLAAATAEVDVYLAPSTGGGPGGDGPPPNPAPVPPPPLSATQRHFRMANLACYPAVALPNGFAENGAPTSVIFMARPFAEAPLLAFAKWYQDATNFHRQMPPLFRV